MSASTRFEIAIHLLTVMAIKGAIPIGSEDAARRANTNAAVVRKIVGMLNRAGFTTSQAGAKGGSMLAKPADQITLLDVYRAVGLRDTFLTGAYAPDQACPVGAGLGPILQDLKSRTDDAVGRELSSVTIAAIAARLQSKEKQVV